MKFARFALITLPAVIWLSVIIFFLWGKGSIDLSAVYMAGYLVDIGRPDLLYATPDNFFGGTPPAWESVLQGTLNEGRMFLSYVYPPLWGWVVAPLTRAVPAQDFLDFARIIQCLITFATVGLALRLAPAGRLPAYIWSPMAFGLLGTTLFGLLAFMLNQLQITVTCLVIAAIVAAQFERQRIAGIALGCAVALKISPIVFVLVLIGARQWRACIWFVVIGGGLGLLSLWLAGWSMHLTFLQQVAHLNATTFLSPTNPAVETVLTQLDLALHGQWVFRPNIRPYQLVNEPLWVAIVTKSGLIICVIALFSRQKRLAVRFLGLAILMPVLGPFAGAHYYILPLMALPALYNILSAREALRWIVFVGLVGNIAVYNLLFQLNGILLATDLAPVLAFGALFTRMILVSPTSDQI